MELVASTLVALILLAGGTAGACPLDFAPEELALAESVPATDPIATTFADRVRPHLQTCQKSDEPSVDRALRLFVEHALASKRPAELKLAAGLVEKKLDDAEDWKIYRVRLREARGHDVFAELESLYADQKLSTSPEALRLLSAARRKSGDIKGAGLIAVEARTAKARQDAMQRGRLEAARVVTRTTTLTKIKPDAPKAH